MKLLSDFVESPKCELETLRSVQSHLSHVYDLSLKNRCLKLFCADRYCGLMDLKMKKLASYLPAAALLDAYLVYRKTSNDLLIFTKCLNQTE